MQLARALDLYLVQLRADGQVDSSVAQAARLLGQMVGALGSQRAVETLRPEDLARYLVAPATHQRPDGKDKRASSMNITRSKIRSFFRHLYEAGYITRDPARLIRRARCPSPPPRALSIDDERRLRKALAVALGRAACRDRTLVALMLGAGLRLGAALSLAVEDLNLAGGEARVARDKGQRSEIVVLPRWVVADLRRELAGRTSGPLFPGADGGPLSARQARSRIAHWGRIAGLKVQLSPHQLRHTMASRLYERTGDLLLVQAALHHRSIQSTVGYLHCATSRLRKALSAPH